MSVKLVGWIEACLIDLWEICYAMGQRFRERFIQQYSQSEVSKA